MPSIRSPDRPSAFPPDLTEDLRPAFQQGSAVIVVGAGLAIAATENPIASWPGLIRSAIGHCRAAALVDDVTAADLLRGTDSSIAEDLVAIADQLTLLLGGRGGGEYARWLRSTVGSLEIVNREPLDALVALNAPICTTNYDGLLERASGRRAVTWRQPDQILAAIRRDDNPIVHLHGFWEDPQSVVLGVESYDGMLDASGRELLRALAIRDTLVLIGIGAGVDDPNLGALRQWMVAVLGGSPYRHFRLVEESEVAVARAQHAPEERVAVVSYGAGHQALAPFLRSLAPARAVPRSATDDDAVVIAVRQTNPSELDLLTLEEAELQVQVNGVLCKIISRAARITTIQLPPGLDSPYEVAVSTDGRITGQLSYSRPRAPQTPRGTRWSRPTSASSRTTAAKRSAPSAPW